jgi:hypothetical protein
LIGIAPGGSQNVTASWNLMSSSLQSSVPRWELPEKQFNAAEILLVFGRQRAGDNPPNPNNQQQLALF